MTIIARRHLRWEDDASDESWELKWLTDGTVMRRYGNQWREIRQHVATYMLESIQEKGGTFTEFPTPGGARRLVTPITD